MDTPGTGPVERLAAHQAVLDLIHAYSHHVDRGDFDAIGELFAWGTYVVAPDQALTGAAVGELLRSRLRVYGNGTPRTMHVNPNVVITFDDTLTRAEAWTPVQVFQKVGGELQCIFLGHYEDEFEFEADGTEWHFATRVAVAESVGDMSAHMVDSQSPDAPASR